MSVKVLNMVLDNGPHERSQFMVLLILANWSDDDGRAFPGIEALARKSRCSVRTVQEVMKQMKASGLVKIEPNAGVSGTNRYTINLKMLTAIGAARAANECDDAERGAETAPPQKLHPAEGDEKGVQNAYANCTQYISTHHITPQSAQARVREPISSKEIPQSEASELDADQGNEDVRQMRRAFQALVNGWPGFKGLSLEGAWKAYQALTPDERQIAARRKDAWIKLLRDQGKDHTPAPSTYCKEKLWEAVPDRVEPQAGSQQMAAPFGKAWSYHVLNLLKSPPSSPPPPSAFQRTVIDEGGELARRLIRDRKAAHGWPAANRVFDAAMDGRGCTVGAVELPEMEAVEKNSPTFDEWRVAFSEAGLPWMRVPDAVRFVWLPKGGPSEWLTPPGSGPSLK